MITQQGGSSGFGGIIGLLNMDIMEIFMSAHRFPELEVLIDLGADVGHHPSHGGIGGMGLYRDEHH